MKRKLAVIGLVALALVGCSAQPSGPAAPATPAPPAAIGDRGSYAGDYANKLYANTVVLPDGREITCVILADQVTDKSIGGLDCDWDTANGVFEEPR